MGNPNSGIKEALDLTIGTINKRSKSYKNTVILVVVLAFVFAIWTVIKFSWRPLTGYFLIVPLSGFYFYFDTRLVSKWQQRIMELWVWEKIKLDFFFQTLQTMKMLPTNTLQSMLDTLPYTGHTSLSQNASPALKQSLASTLLTINDCQNARTGFNTLAYTLGLVFIANTALQGTWLYLTGLFLVYPVIALGKWCVGYRLGKLKSELAGILPNTDIPEYTDVAARLEWGSVSDETKQNFLDSIIATNNISPKDK